MSIMAMMASALAIHVYSSVLFIFANVFTSSGGSRNSLKRIQGLINEDLSSPQDLSADESTGKPVCSSGSSRTRSEGR